MARRMSRSRVAGGAGGASRRPASRERTRRWGSRTSAPRRPAPSAVRVSSTPSGFAARPPGPARAQAATSSSSAAAVRIVVSRGRNAGGGLSVYPRRAPPHKRPTGTAVRVELRRTELHDTAAARWYPQHFPPQASIAPPHTRDESPLRRGSRHDGPLLSTGPRRDMPPAARGRCGLRCVAAAETSRRAAVPRRARHEPAAHLHRQGGEVRLRHRLRPAPAARRPTAARSGPRSATRARWSRARDLMLLHPDGREEVLVAGEPEASRSPTRTSRSTASGSTSPRCTTPSKHKGADIYKVHVADAQDRRG